MTTWKLQRGYAHENTAELGGDKTFAELSSDAGFVELGGRGVAAAELEMAANICELDGTGTGAGTGTGTGTGRSHISGSGSEKEISPLDKGNDDDADSSFDGSDHQIVSPVSDTGEVGRGFPAGSVDLAGVDEREEGRQGEGEEVNKT